MRCQLFFVVYREIAFFACPTCVVFTFVANLRLHKVSPKCVAKGDKLHNIRVLLEPAYVSASGYNPPRASETDLKGWFAVIESE